MILLTVFPRMGPPPPPQSLPPNLPPHSVPMVPLPQQPFLSMQEWVHVSMFLSHLISSNSTAVLVFFMPYSFIGEYSTVLCSASHTFTKIVITFLVYSIYFYQTKHHSFLCVSCQIVLSQNIAQFCKMYSADNQRISTPHCFTAHSFINMVMCSAF